LIVCRVVDRVIAGDHAVVIAEPLLGEHRDGGAPLLYHMGRYACLTP
jgi:flavin reductase (DIM6/NTAB) family NADH-FMN oxidoreductase RutF